MELTPDFYMRKALGLAEMAADEGEVPIGALVTFQGQIIGKGYNQTQRLQDVTAHAEMVAITAASNQLDSKYLDECELYVTVEPCVMCAGAIKHARFKKIFFGAPEPKTGYSQFAPHLLIHAEITQGVLEDECRQIMQDFFRSRRD